MRATTAGPLGAGPFVASYGRAVTERIRAGEPFGDVEDAIDRSTDLTMDQQSALWLLAFSLRDHGEQLRDAWAHLAAVQRGPTP
jgi:hypothetical protein